MHHPRAFKSSSFFWSLPVIHLGPLLCHLGELARHLGMYPALISVQQDTPLAKHSTLTSPDSKPSATPERHGFFGLRRLLGAWLTHSCLLSARFAW